MLPAIFRSAVVQAILIAGCKKDEIKAIELKGGGWFADGYSRNKEGKSAKKSE
jgi:hypothetical protein